VSVIGATSTKNIVSGKDVILCPYFSPKLHKFTIVDIVGDKSTPRTPQTFTIVEYDKDRPYNLTYTEKEGFQFLGFYYVSHLLSEDGDIVSTKESKINNATFTLDELFTRDKIGSFEIRAKYREYICSIILEVNGKTIETFSQEMNSDINKDYYYSRIPKKFGFIYVMNDVPKTATGSNLVIRVSEIPLLWIALGVLVVVGIILIIIVASIKKKKMYIDRSKLDIILNNIEQRNKQNDDNN
jgi:hypothetical protein